MSSRPRPGSFHRRLLSRLAALGGTALIVSSLLMTVAATAALGATSGNSGAQLPGATTSPNQWTDAGNATAITPAVAFARPASGNSLSQGYQTFGLGVPKGSIVDGIEVAIKAKSTDSSGCTLDVRLSGNGGSTLRTKTINLTDSDVTPFTLGSNSDTWGQVWDPTQTINANFQVILRANDSGNGCNDADAANNEATTSVDYFTVTVYYRTMNQHTDNPALSGTVCNSGDFNFIIDMSGSIGAQGDLPSNLQQMKDGINGFVNAFQLAGGDGRYAGTRFSGSSATTITSGYTTRVPFQDAVNALSGPSGLTPTATGITTGAANDSGDRAGVPNVMFVLTDGSPNKPNTHSDDLAIPETWLQGADAAVNAANSARSGGYVVKAVYLSTDDDPGDSSLPFTFLGDRQWANEVMDQIAGGDGEAFAGDFTDFVDELFEAIDCPPPPPADIHISKTASPAGPVLVGGTIGFNITISNTGLGAATAVTIHDDLPAGAGLDWSLVPAFDGCAITGAVGSQDLDCSFALLGSGDSKGPIHVQSGTARGDCGTIDNTATVSASNDDPASNPASVAVQCPDVSVEKSPNSGTVNAGQNAVFTIVVTNGGPGPATGVTLTDTLPSGYSWTVGGANAASCGVATGVLTCNFGTVAANDTRTVTLTAPTTGQNCAVIPNTASVVASNEKTAGDNNSNDASIDVLCGNVGIVKTANPTGPVSAGAEIGFDITVSNSGDGAANAVHLVDNLPAGIVWTADATTGTASATCSIDTAPNPDVLTCDAASMAAGTNFKVHIHGLTDADDCKTISNSATVSSGNDGGGTSSASVTVQCPDVKVTKTPDNAIVNVGDPIVWTIKVENIGQGSATGVVVTDTLPAGIAWSESEADCSIAGGVLTCNVGTLAAGASKTYSASGPTTKANCGPAINNTASATATNEPQNLLANNSDQGSVTIPCPPEISVLKSALDDTISAGELASFQIVVSNTGQGEALGVVVNDTLPAGIAWIVNDTEHCGIAAGVLTCTFPSIAAGDAVTVIVTGETSVDDCGTLTNTVTVSVANDGQLPHSSTATIKVDCATVVITKTAEDITAVAGDTIAFTIEVKNTGAGTAFNVHVLDSLPTGLNWVISPANAAWTIEAGVLEFGPANLAGGASASVRIQAATDATDCGVVQNTASFTYTGNQGDSDRSDISVRCPDVDLEKSTTDADGKVEPNQIVTYGIEVSVTEGPVTNAVVTDDLPVGQTYVADSQSSTPVATSFAVSPDGRTLTWTFASLDGADAASISYNATIDAAASSGNQTNQAEVCVDEPLVDCDSDTVVVLVQQPVITIVKTAGDAADGAVFQTEAGSVTYSYVITNSGPLALTGVVVTDDNGTPDATGDDFAATCPKTTLAPAESMTCTSTILVTVDTTNLATVRGVTAGGNPATDSDEADVEILAFGLTIEKSNDAPIETLELTDGSTADLPTADEGETVVYTLAYTLSGDPVTTGIITDVVPEGLSYVVGSATSNEEFSFVGYDPVTRTLTWTAEAVTESGSLTYSAVVEEGANEFEQPLTNVVTIVSDQTEPDVDTSDVFVPVIPEGETDIPSAPPTDTLEPTQTSQPGSSLPLILAVLGIFLLAVAFVTPVPAPARRRNRR